MPLSFIMGCWDTPCAICSVHIVSHEQKEESWLSKIIGIVRNREYECIENMNFGGTSEFFAKVSSTTCIPFHVGHGWSEYNAIGVVVHKDCFDMAISLLSCDNYLTDKFYKNLFSIVYNGANLNIDVNKHQYFDEKNYETCKHKLESPKSNSLNKIRILQLCNNILEY